MIIEVNEKGEGITWRIGKEYSLERSSALCRCGKSQNKPYCDGTHTRINFDGTETAGNRTYLEEAEVTEGPNLRLTDVEKICAYARFCDPEGGTWELTRQSDDQSSRELAIKQTRNCPSGRLVAWEKETNVPLEPELQPSLGLVEDPFMKVSGPIWVRGRIPVESADGKIYEIRNRVTLCRCGKSSIKPFCDASHRK
jgi:CDGSH-type Zn-finger protein